MYPERSRGQIVPLKVALALEGGVISVSSLWTNCSRFWRRASNSRARALAPAFTTATTTRNRRTMVAKQNSRWLPVLSHFAAACMPHVIAALVASALMRRALPSHPTGSSQRASVKKKTLAATSPRAMDPNQTRRFRVNAATAPNAIDTWASATLMANRR
jgi:hypothetical protein